MAIRTPTPAFLRLVLAACAVIAAPAAFAGEFDHYGEYCPAPNVTRSGTQEDAAAALAPLVLIPGVQGGAVLREDGQRRLTFTYTDFIDPDTFVATLNGKDISDAFDLLACRETLQLPLRMGGNTLMIRASRLGAGKGATDLPQVYSLAVILREPETAQAIRETPPPKDHALARAEEWIRESAGRKNPGKSTSAAKKNVLAGKNSGVVGY